jgi:tetratricopeptide (TPR) repeat protein
MIIQFNNLKRLCLIVLYGLHMTMSFGQQSAIQEAKEAFDNGEYVNAIQSYENIIDSGFTSAALHYNLGNAYFKSNDLGRAILHYEKSLKLKKDADTEYNLSVVNELKKDKLAQVEPFVLNQWWLALRNLMSSSSWAWVTWTVLLLMAGALCIWLLADNRKRRKQGFVIGLILLPVVIFSLVASLASKDAEVNPEYLVVLTETTTLYYAPDTLSKPVIQLHSGTKAEIGQYLSGWFMVNLSDGEEGWLKESDVGTI